LVWHLERIAGYAQAIAVFELARCSAVNPARSPQWPPQLFVSSSVCCCPSLPPRS